MSRSQSPHPPDRSARSPARPPRQPNIGPKVLTRPSNALTGFTEAFNTKQIKDIVIVVCHGSSRLEQFCRETREPCKTVFDTIFGCELGMSTTLMESSYELCKEMFAPPFTTDGSKLIQRLTQWNPILLHPYTTLTFKSMNEPVADMDLFQPGFYRYADIDDGMFHFSMPYRPPGTHDEVKALNIADRIFLKQNPAIKQDSEFKFYTESNSYTTRSNQDIKLSNIIGPDGALIRQFDPTTTAVIILACRNVLFENYVDIAIQSPSPAPSCPWLSPAPSCSSPAPSCSSPWVSPAPSCLSPAPSCLSPAPGSWLSDEFSPAPSSIGDGCLSPAPRDGCLSPVSGYDPDVWRCDSPIPDWLMSPDATSGGKRNSKTRRGGRHKKWIKRKTPLCCKRTIRRKKKH
jgi:hypothetical protein